MAGPLVAVPNLFVNGTVADAPLVDADFQNLVDQVNALFTTNFLNPAYGGTGAGSILANHVVIGGGTGPLITTGNGTAGQVLTSNGASVPTFQSPASTAMVLLQTVVASGNSMAFTGISTAYNNFRLIIEGLSAVSPQNLVLQIGQGGGPTWDTSANYSSVQFNIAVPPNTGGMSSTGSSIAIDIGSNIVRAVPDSTTLIMDFSNIASTTQTKSFSWIAGGSSGANLTSQSQGIGNFNGNTAAITAIRLNTAGAGNFTAGQGSLYGLSS